jgi:hypothetical protein
MVDAHPALAIPEVETHWIPRYLKRQKWLTPDGHVTSELFFHLVADRRFQKLRIPQDKLRNCIESGAAVGYSSFVTRIFDLYGERRGKKFVGDKSPCYVRSIPILHALWPAARFVHLIRDGRDVCLSASTWKRFGRATRHFSATNPHPAATAALWWKSHVKPGLEAGRSLGPGQYHEMRYENLVKRPVEECTALCRFLGIPYADAMVRFHEGRTKAKPGLSAKKAWLPITPGLRDWRSQMAVQDVEQFEAVAGDLLDELGYNRSLFHLPPRTPEHAARDREVFAQHVCELLPERSQTEN